MTAKIEAPPNVYQRLNDARERFHSLELKKSGKNTFANYSYFELGDFLIPAMRIFREVGLAGVVTFHADTAYLEVVNVDEPGDKIVFRSPMGSASLKGCHEVQNIGAVETYQRRYLWSAALEILEHDALDATTGSKEPEPRVEYEFPDGPATGISQLKTMARALWREVDGCGDEDQLLCLIEAPENKAVIEQLSALQNPAHREIWEGDGKDNPGLYGHIQRKTAEFKAELLRA